MTWGPTPNGRRARPGLRDGQPTKKLVYLRRHATAWQGARRHICLAAIETQWRVRYPQFAPEQGDGPKDSCPSSKKAATCMGGRAHPLRRTPLNTLSSDVSLGSTDDPVPGPFRN